MTHGHVNTPWSEMYPLFRRCHRARERAPVDLRGEGREMNCGQWNAVLVACCSPKDLQLNGVIPEEVSLIKISSWEEPVCQFSECGCNTLVPSVHQLEPGIWSFLPEPFSSVSARKCFRFTCQKVGVQQWLTQERSLPSLGKAIAVGQECSNWIGEGIRALIAVKRTFGVQDRRY